MFSDSFIDKSKRLKRGIATPRSGNRASFTDLLRQNPPRHTEGVPPSCRRPSGATGRVVFGAAAFGLGSAPARPSKFSGHRHHKARRINGGRHPTVWPSRGFVGCAFIAHRSPLRTCPALMVPIKPVRGG